MDLKLIVQLFFRALPIRFIGELLLLGLIILFVEFQINENKTLDWRQYYKVNKTEKSIDKNIIVIKIDDYAFRSIPGGEVSREYLAELITEIKSYSPKVIGLDFLLTTPYSDKNAQLLTELRNVDPEYKDPDQRMTEALQSDIPIVLGADMVINDKEKVRLIQPIDSFLLENVQPGFTKVNLDKDDVCREVYLYRNISGKDFPAFATQICLNLGKVIDVDYLPNKIQYLSPAKTYSAFSSKDILDGKFRQVSDNWFKDKIILIGVTYTGSGDFFKSPLSGILNNREDLPGIFIHAMTIKNMLDQSFIPEQKKGYNLIMMVITLLILITGTLIFRKIIGTLVFLTAGIIHIILCFRLFINEVNLPFLIPLLIVIAGMICLHLFCRIRKEYINERDTV